MQTLILGCIRRPVAIIMMLSALLLGGMYSLLFLPLERMPEIHIPRVSLECRYPGMGAEEMRSIISIPVEDALSSIRGLERIRSISRDGSVLVSMDFTWGTDPAAAAVLVREAIDAVYPQLPQGAEKPLVLPALPDEQSFIIITLRSRRDDTAAASRLADYELRSRFRRIEGISSVILSGVDTQDAVIQLNTQRAFSQSLYPHTFARILSSEWKDLPAGIAQEGDMELSIVSIGKPESFEALGVSPVPGPAGPVHIDELADVYMESAPGKSVFVSDAEAVIALELYRKKGADPVRLSRRIHAAVDEVKALFGRDFEIRLIHDTSHEIAQGMKDLLVTSLFAVTAVIISLFLCLKSIRASFYTALSLPVAAAASLCTLALSGQSLNAMSLGGIAMGIGLVSDSSVLVLDLLVRNHAGKQKDAGPEQISRTVAALSASSLGSTLTTAVVFIPVLFLPGPLGAIYSSLSIALLSSIFTAWLYSQFCLPALFHAALCHTGFDSGTKKVFGPDRLYHHVLKRIFRAPLPFALGICFMSAAGVYIISTAPFQFMPKENSNCLQLSVSFPPGTSLEYIEQTVCSACRRIDEIPGIEKVFGKAGAEDEDTIRRANISYIPETAELYCYLAPGTESTLVLEQINGLGRDNVCGTGILYASIPQDQIEKLLGLATLHSLVIKAPDRTELEKRFEELDSCFKGSPIESAAILSSYPSGVRSEIRLVPKREQSALLHLSVPDLSEQMRTNTEGVYAADLEFDGRPLKVRVRGMIPEREISTEAMLEAMPLKSGSDTPVFLGSVADIYREYKPAALARLDRSDVLYIEAQAHPGMDDIVNSSFNAVQNELEYVSRADESIFNRYGTSLLLSLVMVILLLYLSLGLQFDSFVLPLVLMAGIPFSLSGAGPFIRLFSGPMDSGSVLGLAVLFGLSVNNGIILYETCLEKIQAGYTPVRAAYVSAASRLRPVLAAMLSTVFALIPLLVTPLGAGQKSMAAAMLGGVISSTILTLCILPSVFVLYFRKRR